MEACKSGSLENAAYPADLDPCADPSAWDYGIFDLLQLCGLE